MATAYEIDAAKDFLVAKASGERAGGIGAGNIEQADHGEAVGRRRGGEAAAGDVGRQVDLNERDVKAADEEPRKKQPITAMAAGFP